MKTASDVVGEEPSVTTDSVDEARVARALEIEAKRIEPTGGCHSALMQDLPSVIENRNVEPVVVSSKTRSPKHGLDSGILEVELGR